MIGNSGMRRSNVKAELIVEDFVWYDFGVEINLAGIFLLKVNKGTPERVNFLTLTINTLEQRHWCSFCAFIANFECSDVSIFNIRQVNTGLENVSSKVILI